MPGEGPTTTVAAMPAAPPEPEGALPLADLRVIDLTVARAGPTCVRQLADWGADVIRIEPPVHAGDPARSASRAQLGLPEPPPQQALAHPRPQADRGARAAAAPGRRRRRARREHAPAGEVAPRLRLRDGARRATRGSCTGRSRASARTARTPTRGGVDQIAQGMGGLMSVTGPARHRADACRHPGVRPLRRPLPRHRHPRRAARARAHRRGPLGADVAARGDDRDDGLPGDALDHRRRGARAGGQPPPDHGADGLLPHRPTAT